MLKHIAVMPSLGNTYTELSNGTDTREERIRDQDGRRKTTISLHISHIDIAFGLAISLLYIIAFMAC